jgi:ABC-2 type transport system ATP-binding protein
MKCPVCGFDMVESRVGFLCINCGHIESADKAAATNAVSKNVVSTPVQTTATADTAENIQSTPAPPPVSNNGNSAVAANPNPAAAVPAAAEPQNAPLAALEIKNLCKTFGTFKAVDDLTFTVRQGEVFGLLGPNGSGKTTTMNMISGLNAQTSGAIQIMGLDILSSTRQVHGMLGFVPQETALYEELSAWRNMEFHADLYGVPRKEKSQRIISLLQLVQLFDRKDSLVRTFSGGMKRRLAIARALLHEPKIIYLDEPTIGVDVQARRVIWDYILALRAQGKTILITTNYLEEAEALCDRLAIIDQGKLIVLDTPNRLKQKYGGRVLEVETFDPKNARNALNSLTNIVTLEELGTLKEDITIEAQGNILKITVRGSEWLVAQVINLLALKNEIKKISVREPDLDEIFLRLTGSALRD